MQENEKNLEDKLVYSDEASKELKDLSLQVLDLLDTAIAVFSSREITLEQWSLIKKEQRKIMRMSSQAQNNHMERLRDKKCTFEQGLTFVESLNSLSRIVNHISNIAESMLSAEVRGGLPGANVG
jgi:Na+/phosphate symporter